MGKMMEDRDKQELFEYLSYCLERDADYLSTNVIDIKDKTFIIEHLKTTQIMIREMLDKYDL